MRQIRDKIKFKHDKPDWDSNHNRIILYADIMGFKAKLKTTKHPDLAKELREFVKNVSTHLSPYNTGGHLRMTLFSDLVVIAADRCDIPNYKLIVCAASALMMECHKMKYPINGCIACGPLLFDEPERFDSVEGGNNMKAYKNDTRKNQGQYMPLFAGQSVVDAYQLCESLFCYGIVLHPSAEDIHKQAINCGIAKYNMPLMKIPVPIKPGGVAKLYF